MSLSYGVIAKVQFILIRSSYYHNSSISFSGPFILEYAGYFGFLQIISSSLTPSFNNVFTRVLVFVGGNFLSNFGLHQSGGLSSNLNLISSSLSVFLSFMLIIFLIDFFYNLFLVLSFDYFSLTILFKFI